MVAMIPTGRLTCGSFASCAVVLTLSNPMYLCYKKKNKKKIGMSEKAKYCGSRITFYLRKEHGRSSLQHARDAEPFVIRDVWLVVGCLDERDHGKYDDYQDQDLERHEVVVDLGCSMDSKVNGCRDDDRDEECWGIEVVSREFEVVRDPDHWRVGPLGR